MISAAAASVSTGESVTFWILAPIAVLCALAMVIASNAGHCALCRAGEMRTRAGAHARRGLPRPAGVQGQAHAGGGAGHENRRALEAPRYRLRRLR